MNNSQNKTMDEIIVELQQNVMELKIQYEKEYGEINEHKQAE